MIQSWNVGPAVHTAALGTGPTTFRGMLLRFAVPPADIPIVEISAAVAGLYDGDAQAMFGFVRRLGLTDAQADDAVQEVFTRLLAEYRRGVTVASPRSWAYRSIYRLAMDQHRLRRRVQLLARSIGGRYDPGGVDQAERIAVWSEVDRLPERQRQVVYLRYRADLAYDEIGQALGITPGAARSHATQAMSTLRTRLASLVEGVEAR
ncbi:MAG: RNA polymerase sigma factor [Candidatus Limnocylindria bacterium]